jgi:hypothetical protein
MTHKLVLVNEAGRRIGQDHHRAKLSNRDVDQIFELRELGLSYTQIASKFDDIEGGVGRRTVRDILNGKRRGQVPYATRKVLVRAVELAWLPALPEEFPIAL